MRHCRTLRTGLSAAMTCGILLLGGSQTVAAVADADRPIAEIGSVKITEKDLKAEMEKGGSGLSGRFERPEQREALLEELVRSEVLYATALKNGYDRKTSVVDALKRIIINQYRQDNLEPQLAKITVTENEIKAFYHDRISDFSIPQMVRVAVIEIAVPAKVSDEKRAELLHRAEDARAAAMALDRATPSFGPVAVKYSDDQVSRYRGGDTGLMKRGDAAAKWGKELTDAIFSLRGPGQVSQVIASPGGYHIIKLMESKESVNRPLAEVKELIRNRLFFEKKMQIEKEFYLTLASELKVEINRELLGRIQPPDAGVRPAPPAMPRQQ